MSKGILLVVAGLLIVAPLAGAGAVTARYVGGAYVPGTFHGACLGGNTSAATPGVSGVCRLIVQPGARTITVRDDALGLRSFYWQLSPAHIADFCRDGDVVGGVLSIVVAAECNEFSVYVQAGSTTGVVRID